MLKNKGIGGYFVLAAAVLSVISLFVYGMVLNKTAMVFVLTIVAVVLAVVSLVMGKDENPIYPWVTCVNGALTALGAALSAGVMVDAIGYVISGLNTFDTIQSYVIYLVIAIAAMVCNILAGFLKFYKEA